MVTKRKKHHQIKAKNKATTVENKHGINWLTIGANIVLAFLVYDQLNDTVRSGSNMVQTPQTNRMSQKQQNQQTNQTPKTENPPHKPKIRTNRERLADKLNKTGNLHVNLIHKTPKYDPETKILTESSKQTRQSNSTTDSKLSLRRFNHNRQIIPKKFKTRTSEIKNLCKLHNYTSLNKPDKWRNHAMSYLNRLRTFACLIPKTGCTNWRRTFVAIWKRQTIEEVSPFLNGKFDSNFYKMIPQFANNPYYAARGLDKIRVNTRWWNRLITVRHPFSRLYSVWLDKFHNHPEKPDYSKQLIRFRKLAKNVAKFKKPHKTSDGLELTRHPDSFVSFQTFLRYIVSETHQDDPHWGSFYKLCAPCDISYNIITKVETLDEDSDEIFKILKIPKSVGHFPKSNFHSNFVSEEFLKELYKKLPRELVIRLYAHYEEDFVLFGYGIEEYLADV